MNHQVILTRLKQYCNHGIAQGMQIRAQWRVADLYRLSQLLYWAPLPGYLLGFKASGPGHSSGTYTSDHDP
jgi:hypothetical protein